MKIIVSIKQVPDTSGKVAVNPDGTLNRASMQTITNPDDMNAIEAGRLLTYQAAVMKGQGVRYTQEAAMAKLFTSEHAMKTTTKAVQLHGGYGYTNDYPVERMMRDAKITEIYEGTSEVQRMVISSRLGVK